MVGRTAVLLGAFAAPAKWNRRVQLGGWCPWSHLVGAKQNRAGLTWRRCCALPRSYLAAAKQNPFGPTWLVGYHIRHHIRPCCSSRRKVAVPDCACPPAQAGAGLKRGGGGRKAVAAAAKVFMVGSLPRVLCGCGASRSKLHGVKLRLVRAH